MTAALKQATQLKIQVSVVKGPHAGQTFNLNKPALTIGRGPENDIVLVNDPLVSRIHARIELNNGEFDLINLSQKNGLSVQGEFVDKWRLVNDSTFQVGDSEIKFQFDFGQAVVSVQPQARANGHLTLAKPEVKNSSLQNTNVQTQVSVPVTQKPQTPPPASAVSVRSAGVEAPKVQNRMPGLHQQQAQQVGRPQQGFAQAGYAAPKHNAAAAAQAEAEKNKKIRFYAIVGIALVAFTFFIMSPNEKAKSKKAKAILKYEDEIQFNQNSKSEVELRKKREEDKKTKDSPQAQRAEENFIKGMRDFQLGNYARAQDFFQVVLNLIPDHALARRHLYLSKVRFDEIVQAKLMLGESYYQKHNFGMCQSMYQQVMDMLLTKSSDQKYKLAQQMAEKCQLASEGIR
ncbi:MAG: FHA domain-containing protein [Bdellovibrio sp.]|nr:FHA domain-containing protein [Bdellovibrio sp.]